MTLSLAKFLSICALGVVSVSAGLAQAQPVYRIIGADGKITFSDKPPASDTQGKLATNAGASGSSKGGALPYELRQIAARYPVTLYVSDNCGPCALAKTMLVTRGVPFSEKTVNSAEDVQALQRLSGENTLPFATIGSQQLKGYSDAEWLQFLNAAGYPATSVLPANYRPSAATPLVSVSTATAPTPAPVNTAPAKAAPAPSAAPSGTNPAGIKF